MARPMPLPVIAIEDYLPMLRYWARHYAQHHHQVLDYEDFLVVGMMGLLDAQRRYNPQRDVLFKTYAEFRIRGEIIDELRRQDWMSRGERRKQKLYRKALEHLQQDLGRPPTQSELAKILHFPQHELTQLALCESDPQRHYQDGDGVMTDERDTLTERLITQEEVERMLKHLPPLHRLVLERRYFSEASLTMIAAEIKLTTGRVSQLHSEALAMLRDFSLAA